MGACTKFMTVRHCLRNEGDRLHTIFRQAQEDDAWSLGHKYSGGFNMCSGLKITQRSFATEEEAEDWIADNAEKWQEALAVYVPAHGWVIGGICAM